jgi:hypothetical protein
LEDIKDHINLELLRVKGDHDNPHYKP